MSTDTNDTDNANGSESTTLGAIRGALERIPDDDVDEAAALVERLQLVREFDTAETREPRPVPLDGGPTTGAQQYAVEGETPKEWLVTNYTVPVGGSR